MALGSSDRRIEVVTEDMWSVDVVPSQNQLGIVAKPECNAEACSVSMGPRQYERYWRLFVDDTVLGSKAHRSR